MSETQPADPRARRRALGVVALSALLGATCLLALLRNEEALLGLLRAYLPLLLERTWIAALVTALLATPVVCLGVYLYRLARQAVRVGRFPPPGVVVARGTKVRQGAAAHRLGRWLQVLAVVLIVAAAAMIFAVWRLFELLANGA